MNRYYFDVREGDHVTVDNEGVEYTSQDDALTEAARSIAELARDQIPLNRTGHKIVIEARDSIGPVLSVSVVYEATSLRTSEKVEPPIEAPHPSAEEVFRLLEAFSLADAKTKAELVALAERLASESPEFAEELRKDKTRH